MPGTIVSRTRLIPGNPGLIVGGNSQLLKSKLLDASGINRSIAATGFQAHHIIPTQIGNESHWVLKKIGMKLDDATNGILLPDSIHTGRHRAYTEAIREALDRIPKNASIQTTMERVYEIQAKAVWAFVEQGASLRGRKTTLEQWREILK